ncbi:Integrase catalytic domain-containing protein [Aphis craccivora]|uniref:Integrase catalytic domain-containing protein n=1 Tax=Aphis craccivora TaxID=307492 RepID=A0A6G0Y2I7_APHCR|nr:Integrase catalytic domain-containing protein [Aphis craccivora]
MSILNSLAEELHGPVRKIFPRRNVVTRFKDDLWQADLIDMQPHSRQNNGFKFILIIIDTFTKYVWVEALKNKTAKECTNLEYFSNGRAVRRGSWYTWLV